VKDNVVMLAWMLPADQKYLIDGLCYELHQLTYLVLGHHLLAE
jgi:hypothetical protein